MKNLLTKIKNVFINLFNSIIIIFRLFFACQMPLYSANAAFFLIISGIPISMLLFSTISLIPNVKIDVLIENINFLFPNLPYVRYVVNHIIKIARELAAKSVISVNLILTIIAGSTALYSFIIGIRRIHGITRKSNFFSLRIISIANMFVFFISVILMVFAFLLGSMIIGFIEKYFPFAENMINNIFGYRYIIAFLILFTLMISTYTISTNFERKIKHNIIGASISTLSWLIISNIFSIYFKKFPINVSVYGSLAGIVLVLFWLFICINIIFLGATINEFCYPEKRILNEQKISIMNELAKGDDEEVDKIINQRFKLTKISSIKKPQLDENFNYVKEKTD